MRVLGIDPGTLAVGYGVVEETEEGRVLIGSGTIKAPRSQPTHRRLKVIYEDALLHGPLTDTAVIRPV